MTFVRISEHDIERAASLMTKLDNSHDNNFKIILSKIDIFKQAKMTPMILMNTDNYALFVVAEETFMKKLH